MKNRRHAEARLGHRTVIAIAAVALGPFPFVSAEAATITNTDSMPHTVTVENTTPPQVHAIAPQSQKKDICPAGCVVKLDGHEDRYIVEGGELLSIEDGTLYYDGNLPKAKVEQPQQ